MKKYIKKPIKVEAEQWLGSNISTLIAFMKTGKTDFSTIDVSIGKIYILTLKETVTIQIGDWVIKGSEDELYLCHDHLFKKTYELILL